MRQFILLGIFLYSGIFSFTYAQKTADDLAEKGNVSTDQIIANKGAVTQGQARFMPAPPAPAATGDNLCAPGTANLSATASSGGTLDWYNVATGGTSIGTGATFNPVVSTTTNFWVEEVVGGAGGSGSALIAPYNSNNGQRGAMFNLTAANAVTVTNIDANLYAGTTANYEIYYRAGTHVGFETNAAAWTLLGSATGVTSLGNNVPTPIPITFSVSIPAGQTYSFYVTNDFGGGTSYTDGTAVGNFLASDANLTIYEGVGKSYPFGLTFNVRNFNGHIHYTTGAGPSSSPRTLVTANVKTPVYANTASTTTSNATCTVNESGVDWTYYYNTANPNDLLFAIAHDPLNLGNNSFTANASITVNANSTSTGYYSQANGSQQLARFVMGRYWNVNLTSGTIVDPVWVRYYYQPGEKTAIQNAATAWQGMNGGTISSIYLFKTQGVPFNPPIHLHPSGVYNSIELVNYTDNQTSLNGTNYVEIHDVNSFSGGSLIIGVVPVGGTTSGDAILLDLKLLDFSAKKDQQTTILNWTTEEEKNMQHFVIERSVDGIHFDEIGEVAAQNKEGLNVYEWIDKQPYANLNYYRLKMLEETGGFSYSELNVVSFEEGNLIAIYPNPFGDKLEISLNTAAAEDATIVLWNSLGQVVYQQAASLSEGSNVIRIPVAVEWEAGCYVVGIKGSSLSLQRKVIKK